MTVHDVLAAWLAVADDDLSQIINNLEGPEPTTKGAAYHAQQAAEKLIKLVLIAEHIEPHRTHNITMLLMQLPDRHPLEKKLQQLIMVAGYDIAYRYPGDPDDAVPPLPPPAPILVREWLATLRHLRSEIVEYYLS